MIMEFSIVMGIPRVAGWFLSENPILKWDDHWGYPQFFRTFSDISTSKIRWEPHILYPWKNSIIHSKTCQPYGHGPRNIRVGEVRTKNHDFSTHEKSGYIIHIHISSYHWWWILVLKSSWMIVNFMDIFHTGPPLTVRYPVIPDIRHTPWDRSSLRLCEHELESHRAP